MQVIVTERGFEWLEYPTYSNNPKVKAIARQSSAIGDYPDAMDRPGSSFLWIGNQDAKETHHLNREEVAEFVKHLQTWLKTGKFAAPTSPSRPAVL